MSEVPYERYKDALRRGHVAALRGRLDAAAAAYREAASIAPDRALPYVGLGGVLSRLGRADQALDAYASALDRAPTDEAALHGRADGWLAQHQTDPRVRGRPALAEGHAPQHSDGRWAGIAHSHPRRHGARRDCRRCYADE